MARYNTSVAELAVCKRLYCFDEINHGTANGAHGGTNRKDL